MKTISLQLLASLALALVLGATAAGGASAAVGDQLLNNPGLESGSGGSPSYWSFGSWSTGNTIRATGTWSTDAHSGMRSVRVDVTAYGSDGDAKWLPQAVPVSGGKYYVLSDWYKSNRSSAISVEYWTAGESLDDDGNWANLYSGLGPASTWTQYQTGYTMPADAVYATFVHFIAGVGWLETDDYSITEAATQPGFASPMISLTFDDGSAGFYANVLPKLDAKGFKTTQYIPTQGLTTNPPDPFMMTRAQISSLAAAGHEIGSHSVTHPDLTTVGDSQLRTELVNSRSTLEAIPGVGAVTDFAYPFGTYDARVIAAEQAAGYVSGRSVEEGYNSRLDLAPFDIRVQNMTPSVSLATFQGWVDYAKAHNYWLVIVYHEVQPDNTPRCQNLASDPDPCVGDYDATMTQFQNQLNYITTAGLGSDVMTVRQALAMASGSQTQPPVAGTVKLTPAQPGTNAVVTATATGFSDPGGGALTYTYNWKVNGTAVASTSSAATTATFDLSQAGHGDHGDALAVSVSAANPQGLRSSEASDGVTVANTAPTAGSVKISPSAPTTTATLTAAPSGFADIDGDALTYHYQWSVNGTAVTGSGATYVLAGAGAGDVIAVSAYADDAHGGTSPSVSASVTVAASNAPPTAGSVTIDPSSPMAGATVRATPSAFADPDGDTLTYHYQWSINGKQVAGATAASLALSTAVRGNVVAVAVTADDGRGGTSPAATASVTVANSAPTAGSVAIAPSAPTSGTTLKATPSGFADADRDPLSYQYAWFANGQQIAGASGASLAGSSVVAGATIRVDVRAADAYGGASPVVSATVKVATAVDRTAPTITITSPRAQTYRRGQTLLVQFSCSDSGSGIASCTATIGRVRSAAQSVTSGESVRFTRAGSYRLTVSAKDRAGNSATRTLEFRIR